MNKGHTNKIIVLIVVAGAAIAGWQVWSKSKAPDANGVNQPNGNRKVVTVLASSTHTDNLKSLVADYEKSQSIYSIEFAQSKETRKALHMMLDEPEGTKRISAWLSSCDELGRRFGEAYKEKNGKEIINTDDPELYKVVASAPVAVLAKRSKEAEVRRLFESSNPWNKIENCGLRWSFANPKESSSGTLILGYILWGYAQTTSTPGDLESLSNSAGFSQFLQKIRKHGFVEAPEGSKSHAELFTSGTLDADFVINYSTTLSKVAASNPDFVVIYPTHTVFARHVFSVLLTGSREEQDGAKDFVKFAAEKFPKPVVPSSISPVTIPKYYPYLNDAEIAWDKAR